MRRFESMLCCFLVFLTGCATSATAFKPGGVGKEEAALFGRVSVDNLGEDVTKHCYVELTDSSEKRQRYISLDKTGWLFTSVKPGEVYFSRVLCTVTRGTTFNVEYATRDLSFSVPGGSRIGYFGHVQVEFAQEGENLFAAALTPPIAKAFEEVERAPAPNVEIYNRFSEAVREYQARYGAASGLTPVQALLPLINPLDLPAKPAPKAANVAPAEAHGAEQQPQ